MDFLDRVRRYRKLSKDLHPDKNPSEEARKKFNDVPGLGRSALHLAARRRDTVMCIQKSRILVGSRQLQTE